MDYTSIHIYGHLLTDEVLRQVEQDNMLQGNRDIDYALDTSVSDAIDYVWSSLRNDWNYYKSRNQLNDPYGTRRSRNLIERFMENIGYELNFQQSFVPVGDQQYEVSYLDRTLNNMPFIVIGSKTGDSDLDTLDKCSLDFRAKGQQRKKSAHATMLDYLNATENVYGIVSNGETLRLIRNSGQLVKLTYIEFDIQKMMEEDKYSEFCLMFRLLHASRFHKRGDDACILDQWYNLSVESGNRIRNGLSQAVQKAMELIGKEAVTGVGEGNEKLRTALLNGDITIDQFNKELIHLIYRLLFLFIIEDRGLVYDLKSEDPDYKEKSRHQDIYRKYYAASRLRGKSEIACLHNTRYCDLWEGLKETFRLFESDGNGKDIGISPLGGVLFDKKTLHYLAQCTISNKCLLDAFQDLNEFEDEKGNLVKINYTSLDVEEFGSVYEGILEMRAEYRRADAARDWYFGYMGGLDRKTSSSYYTRPDLVQNLIRTTLEPVIKQKLTDAATKEDKLKALLSMKVCDPASGSGHIVLAMARMIAWYVCCVRTGEDNPASQDYREALREVIQKCIYAVDFNPDAVELCKVVLWIEGYCAGKPLSFLDHHIRCGNSVVGITDLDVLLKRVPKDALTSQDKDVQKAVRSLNDNVALVGQSTIDLFNQGTVIKIDKGDLEKEAAQVGLMPEDTLEQEQAKKVKWEALMQSPKVECLRLACDTYTYAYYHQFEREEMESWINMSEADILTIPYTRTVYKALEEAEHLDDSHFTPLDKTFKAKVRIAARKYKFFHWSVEFPEVFTTTGDRKGGFDVMCGNPPWDKIKVEDKQWFEQHGRLDIVNVGTAAQRKKAIIELPNADPELFAKYQEDLLISEANSRFIRLSNRFPLSSSGDIDLYPLFAEHCLNNSNEAWGLVMPTGIAVNDSNKAFFGKLVEENRLISLYDFENREQLFNIHRMFKFCLLTAGKAQQEPRDVKGGFFLTRLDHLLDSKRIYTINTQDFVKLNPNTKTCPIFRTSKDAELTAKIYRNSTILLKEAKDKYDAYKDLNPWKVKFARMLDMSNDSYLFKTYAQLVQEGAKLKDNIFELEDETYVPLYEGKMIWHYNHHYGTWPTEGEDLILLIALVLSSWEMWTQLFIHGTGYQRKKLKINF